MKTLLTTLVLGLFLTASVGCTGSSTTSKPAPPKPDTGKTDGK